jgi:hypothetical protein
MEEQELWFFILSDRSGLDIFQKLELDADNQIHSFTVLQTNQSG